MKPYLADRSPSLQRIVERQLRKWELEAQQRQGRPSRRPFLRDFVTISREAGSGGEYLAGELGKRLGWKVYDRELLELMSEDESNRQHLYSTLDERQTNWIDGLLVLCAPETMVLRNDYLRALCRTVLTVAHHEHAIFVGRGAHLVLPPDVGLRLRIVARREDRISTLAKEKGLELEEGEREARRLDAERQAFMKKVFGGHGDELTDYDLAINMSRHSPEEACDIILAALRQRAQERLSA
jgi:hypothetical protein